MSAAATWHAVELTCLCSGAAVNAIAQCSVFFKCKMHRLYDQGATQCLGGCSAKQPRADKLTACYTSLGLIRDQSSNGGVGVWQVGAKFGIFKSEYGGSVEKTREVPQRIGPGGYVGVGATGGTFGHQV